MLLRRLTELAEQLSAEMPPAMFEKRRIRWIVPLRPDGTFLGTVEPTCGNDRYANLGKHFVVPYEYRSSQCRARLLADTAEFVLGLIPAGRDPTATDARHASFIREVSRCASVTGNASVRAVLMFLQNWNNSEHRLPEDMLATDHVTFRVGADYPIEDPEIADYWKVVSDPGVLKTGAQRCSVCGQPCPQKKVRHFKIRGIPGARVGGLALVSANISSAESYGLVSSAGVPTCSRCEEAATRAANYLVSNPHTGISSRHARYIFWSKKSPSFDICSLLMDPSPSETSILEQCIFSPDEAIGYFDKAPFHAAALSANGSRVVVRDWIGTSLGKLQSNIIRFLHLQQLIGPAGEPVASIGITALASSECNPKRTYDSCGIEPLIRLALTGGSLPILSLAGALRSNRSERRITRARAAFIKTVLLSQTPESPKEYMVSLDSENTQPAYLCGRLLAILQRLQWLAVGNINSNVVDRFFATASVSPRLVFPHLIRLSQAHFRKVRGEYPGAYAVLQHAVQDLTQELQQFPAALSLPDQGLFALGYYHQVAFDRGRTARSRSSQKLSSLPKNNEVRYG